MKMATPLWLQTLVALLLGMGARTLLSPEKGYISTTQMQTRAPWIGLPGNLFLALIKMIILPLVLSSIVLGINSSED